MHKFAITWNDDSFCNVTAENVYEAIEQIVKGEKIHPRNIKCIERIDEGS